MSLNGFETTLSWSRFKPIKEPPVGSEYDSEMEWRLGFSNVELRSKGRAVVVTKLDVSVTISEQDSWVVESKKNKDLLAHEQGHYDIAALGGRELHEKLKKLSANSVAEWSTAASALLQKFLERVNTIQKRYDSQTE